MMNTKISTTVAYYLCFIILGMATGIIGPTLPGLAEQTSSTLGGMSIIFSARSLGYLIGAFVVGKLYDRGAGHYLMATMLVVTAILFAFVPYCSLLFTLALLVLLLGVSESMVDIGGNTFLVWIHREKVAPYMNALHFFFGVGGFIAPLLVAFAISQFNSISWSFWALAIIILPIAIWLFYLPSPVFKKKDKSGGAEKPFSRSQTRMFFAILAFILLYVSLEFGYGSWLYSYALIAELTDKTGAAFLTSLFWASFTLARLASIPITLRFKPITILFGSLIGVIFFFAILLFSSSSLQVLTICSVGIGVFCAPVFPTTFTFCEKRLGITGARTSMFFVSGSLGAMSLPWVYGQLLENSGPYSMMLAMAATSLLALVILITIYFAFLRKDVGAQVPIKGLS